MADSPRLEFWYDFASTYSYLAAMRIEPLAEKAGVTIRWRPFLLGPIFAAQGWNSSPFNLFPAKGRNMWRDMERQTAALGLPFNIAPEGNFPQNSLLAARVAILGEAEGSIAPFTRAVYMAEFGDNRNISDPGTLAGLLRDLGLDADAMLARAQEQANKDRLKEQTGEAQKLGIYGAPSFVTADGELFWGNDRLEQALDWAARGGAPVAVARS